MHEKDRCAAHTRGATEQGIMKNKEMKMHWENEW